MGTPPDGVAFGFPPSALGRKTHPDCRLPNKNAQPVPEVERSVKSNLTGHAGATLTLYPGGEFDFRAKLTAVSPNGWGYDSAKRYSPDSGRSPQLDIHPNSQRTQNDTHDRPAHDRRNGWGAPARAGKTDIRQAARNRIRRTGYAMAAKYGRENLVFATLTLPGSTPEAIRTFSEWQGYVQNRISVWLSRRFSDGDGSIWVSRWEYQQRGALHAHLLIRVPEKSAFRNSRGVSVSRITTAFRGLWRDILGRIQDVTGVRICARNGGGDWFGYPHKWQLKVLQPDRPACYLAKYVSKKEENKFRPKGWVQYWKMTRPWSVSKASRKLLAEHTISASVPIRPVDVDDCLATITQALSDDAHGLMLIKNKLTLFFIGCKAFVEESLSANTYKRVTTMMESYKVKTDAKSRARVVNPVPTAVAAECCYCNRRDCSIESELSGLPRSVERNLRSIAEDEREYHYSKEFPAEWRRLVAALKECERRSNGILMERHAPPPPPAQLDIWGILA